jgi:lipopolysaccharide export system permease protein
VILFRYLWSEWIKVFGMTAALVMALIVVQEVYSRLQGLLTMGASASEIIRVFFLSVPFYIPSVIPMVLMLSVMFSVGSLHRRNEVMAFKASGVSLLQMSRPVFFASVLAALCILMLNASWIPMAVDAQESLLASIHHRRLNQGESQKDEPQRVIRNLGALNHQEQRLWLMGSYDPYTAMGEEVTVSAMDDAGRECYRVRADRAHYLRESGHWVFFQGRELFYDGRSEEPYRNRTFERLDRPDFREEPDVMVAMRRKPQDLSLRDLQRVMAAHKGYDSAALVPYRVRFYRVWLYPLSCVLVVAFALAYASSGVRTNPMVGISKAFGMFLLYFLVSNLSTILGNASLITPWMAALIPLAMVGTMAVRVFLRAL